MPRIRRSLAGALLGVTAIAAATLAPHDMSASQQTPATGTGIVAGQVIDATTKRPVAGAVVALSVPAGVPGGAPAPPPSAPPSRMSSAPVRRAAAVANAEGRFVFRDVPAGTYTLAATRNGYSPGATGRRRPGGPTRTFTIADGARVTDTVVSMWRLATISGSVRDDRGEPVIGMYVTAMRAVMVAGRVVLNFGGGGGEATDDRGFYRIHNLEPGSYVLMVRTTPQTAAVSTLDKYLVGCSVRYGHGDGARAQDGRRIGHAQ